MRKRAKFLTGGLAAALVLCIANIAIAESSSDSLELPLNEAISIALEQHPDVHQAELDLKLAELELEAAQATMLLPSIDLQIKPPDLTLQGFSGNVQGTLGADITFPWGTNSQLSADLGIAWNSEMSGLDLLNWGIVYSQKLDLARPDGSSQELKVKQEAVEDAQFKLEETRNAVILEAVETYAKLLDEKALLAQAETELEQAKTHLEQVREMVEEGLKGETSLMEARLDVLDAQIELDERRSTYTTDKENFGRVALGINEEFELIPIQLSLEGLKAAVMELLVQDGLVTTAVSEAQEVQAAQRRVTDVQEDLQAASRAVLPEILIEAGLDSQGLRAGWKIAFDIFAPARSTEIEIAQTNLELATEKLKITKEQVRNRILSDQSALRGAIDKLERLTLEEEKWTLEEKVKQAKYEAGVLSEEDWEEFLAEKQAFELSKDERISSLLLAYLSYRDTLGLGLNWEEWLK